MMKAKRKKAQKKSIHLTQNFLLYFLLLSSFRLRPKKQKTKKYKVFSWKTKPLDSLVSLTKKIRKRQWKKPHTNSKQKLRFSFLFLSFLFTLLLSLFFVLVYLCSSSTEKEVNRRKLSDREWKTSTPVFFDSILFRSILCIHLEQSTDSDVRGLSLSEEHRPFSNQERSLSLSPWERIIMPRSWSRHTFVRFLFTSCWFVGCLSSCFLLLVITVCLMRDTYVTNCTEKTEKIVSCVH